jgi:ankyrin repeat protein
MTGKRPKRNARAGVDRLGRTPLHDAIIDGKLGVAKRLLAKGAAPSTPDDNGWTPLHFATKSTHLGLVKLLLDAGADVDAVDSNGNTPLFNAVFDYTDDDQIIPLLLSRGADPTRENKFGVSPLSFTDDLENADTARRLRALLAHQHA